MNCVFRHWLPLVVLGCAFVPIIGRADTTNATWTGGSSGDNNWGSTANWAGGQNPNGSGASTIHFAGSTRLTPYNNYGDYTQFNRIFFDSGAGSFTLGGAVIKLAGQTGAPAKIENNSTVLQTVSFNTGGTSLIYNGGGELDPTLGDLTVNNNIYVDNFGNLDVYGNNGHTLTLNGTLNNGNQSTALNVNEKSNVKLMGANTYTNGTNINAGKVYALNTSGSATGTNTVNIGSAGMLTGTGSVSGAVNVNGKISAGANVDGVDKIGTLTTAVQAWNGGGAYVFKVASTAGSTNAATGPNTQTGNAGINWDKLKMSGLTINANAGSKFTIVITPLALGMTFTNGAKFEIANVSSGTTPTDLSSMFVLDASRLGLPNSSFSLTSGSPGAGESGYDLFLNYTGGTTQSAPEPGTMTLAGLAGGAILTRRRRRS